MKAERSREDVRELLEIEEADAWIEYLCAWLRLRGRLRSIKARRADLVPVA